MSRRTRRRLRRWADRLRWLPVVRALLLELAVQDAERELGH